MAAATATELPDFPALLELRERRQWVAWKYVLKNGRQTKPPVNPHTGEGASHSDPRTWGTYQEAMAYAKAHNFPGVGYVITEDDDLTGADLDHCRDADFGCLEPWAEAVIRLSETYAEVSPSGTGVRIIWRGKIDQTLKCNQRNVEIYRSQRYLTITGDHIAGTPTDIRPAPKIEAMLKERVLSFRLEQEKARAAFHPEYVPPRPGVLQSGPGSGTAFFRAVNDAAIHRLEAWVPQIFGTQAEYQPGTGAWRVSSQSLGRDLEEDLSLSPLGIVDFGVHDLGDPRRGKRTPIDVVLEFGRQPTAKDAAFWLCERLSKNPHDLGWEDGSSSRSDTQEQKQEPRPTGGLIRVFGFDELVTNDYPEEPDYIENNLLGPGGFLLIGGPPKAQKSWLVQELQIVCAISGSFLAGVFTVPRPLRVFSLQAEMNEKLLRRRARSLRDQFSAEELLKLGENLKVSDRFRMILDENGVQQAVALIKSVYPNEPPDVLSFDPMANIYDQENENDNAQVMKFLTLRIEAVRQAVNPLAGVVLVHHATKKGPDEIRRDPFNCFRGGGALRGHYDSGIIIFRKSAESEEREVHFELRGGEPPEPMTVKLENGRMVKTASILFGQQLKGWPDAQTQNAILANIQAAWNRGEPWSNQPRARTVGRYAPKIIHRDYPSVSEAIAFEMINAWLMPDGVLVVARHNSNTKLKGLCQRSYEP